MLIKNLDRRFNNIGRQTSFSWRVALSPLIFVLSNACHGQEEEEKYMRAPKGGATKRYLSIYDVIYNMPPF